METRFDALAEQVFKKNFDNCHADEIRQLVDEFPYFTPAYLLLLNKLKPDSEEYKTVYQKAILYNSDPLSFERFVNEKRFAQDEIITNSPFIEKEVSSATVIDSKPEGRFEHDYNKKVSEFIIKDAPDLSTSISEEEINSSPFVEPLQDEKTPANEEGIELQEKNVHEELYNEEPLGTTGSIESQEESEVELKEFKWNLSLDSEPKGVLSFEPYHTVDYFASQGIKLSQEVNTKDKFGKQLKSFTEWLKTMKRLPEAEISGNIDKNVESKVEHLAAGSIEDSEVVTEAMAEVWLRQGNQSKALEVYNKLSLQNPSKKAYFAAKIEQFNSHN